MNLWELWEWTEALCVVYVDDHDHDDDDDDDDDDDEDWRWQMYIWNCPRLTQKPFDSIIHRLWHWGMIEAWLDNKTIASCQNVSQQWMGYLERPVAQNGYRRRNNWGKVLVLQVR